MTDSADTSSFPAAGADAPPAAASYSSGPSAQGSTASGSADHPELVVGAAFAGGFLAALILKRIAN